MMNENANWWASCCKSGADGSIPKFVEGPFDSLFALI